MKLRNRVRDESTAAGISGVSVAIRGVNNGAAVTSVTTDADGAFEYQANGSPGPIEWSASNGGKTRTLAGDQSVQSGVFFTGEIERMFEGLGAGILAGVDNECAVTPGTGRQVLVGTGIVVGKGIPHIIYTQEAVSLAANSSGNPRIDLIVSRVTRSGASRGKAVLAVVQGTAAASPVAPNPTQDATTWETPLAAVTLANGYSTVTSGNIADKRVNASWGPLAGLPQLGGATVDGELALWNGAGGDKLKRASGTGFAKLISGVLSLITPASPKVAVGYKTSAAGSLTSTGGSSITDLGASVTLDSGVKWDMFFFGTVNASAASGGTLEIGATIDNGSVASMGWSDTTNNVVIGLPFAGYRLGVDGDDLPHAFYARGRTTGGAASIRSGACILIALPRLG